MNRAGSCASSTSIRRKPCGRICDLRPRRSLGMHFGTFQLTDEAIDAPVRALRAAQAEAGVAEEDFDVLGFGETREYAVA